MASYAHGMGGVRMARWKWTLLPRLGRGKGEGTEYLRHMAGVCCAHFLSPPPLAPVGARQGVQGPVRMAELSLVGLVESGPCCFVGGSLDTASLCRTDVACRSLRVANQVSWHERELGSRVSFGVELNEDGALEEIMGAGVKIGGQQLAGWKVGYMSRLKRRLEEHLNSIPTSIELRSRMTRPYPRKMYGVRRFALMTITHEITPFTHDITPFTPVLAASLPRHCGELRAELGEGLGEAV